MQRNRIATAVVTLLLVVSSVVGMVILLTDGYLWAAAPSHAYGLIAFSVLDAGLSMWLWRTTRLALLASALLGAVQFAAMTGDVFVGGPAGLPVSAWEQYLLGDGYFVALLVLQPLVVAGSLALLSYRRAVTRGEAAILRRP